MPFWLDIVLFCFPVISGRAWTRPMDCVHGLLLPPSQPAERRHHSNKAQQPVPEQGAPGVISHGPCAEAEDHVAGQGAASWSADNDNQRTRAIARISSRPSAGAILMRTTLQSFMGYLTSELELASAVWHVVEWHSVAGVGSDCVQGSPGSGTWPMLLTTTGALD